MPIEIRELVVRMKVDQGNTSHSTYNKGAQMTERDIENLKNQMREFCREEIRDLFDREKER